MNVTANEELYIETEQDAFTACCAIARHYYNHEGLTELTVR
jgi:hypothetical protein